MIIFMTGWEINVSEWPGNSNNQGNKSVEVASPDGTYHGDNSCMDTYWEPAVTLPSAKTQLYFKFFINIGAGSPILTLFNGMNIVAKLAKVAAPGGFLIQLQKADNTVLATSTIPIPLAWTGVECRIKLDGASSIADLKIAGIAAGGGFPFTGTISGTYTDMDGFSGCHYDEYDTFIVDDANWVGNLRIAAAIKPAGDSVITWEQYPDTGDHHDKVNKVTTPSDASYIFTDTINLEEWFDLDDVPIGLNIENIRAVQVHIRYTRIGESTPRNLQIAARVGAGIIKYSSSFAVPDSPTIHNQKLLMNVQPDDSTPWGADATALNALKIAVKSLT